MKPRSAAALLIACASLRCVMAQDPDDLSGTRVDGYRGIWFTLGQFFGPGPEGKGYSERSRKPIFPYGDKYSGGLGTYTAKHTPLAIYAPEVNKTFFVYGGTTGPRDRHLLCMISYYDHETHRVPRPVVVCDKQSVDDPHDNPSLCIASDGHLWVFVSGRGRKRPGFKYRSQTPFSIDAFAQVTEEEMTYPQPYYVPDEGFLHLFTKYTGVRELYWETSRDGTHWTPDQQLAGIRKVGQSRGGHYQTSAIQGNRIGTFFNRHPNGNVDQRTDLYYLQTEDFGETWQTVDGRTVDTPIVQIDHPTRVIDYASQGLNVYLKDMAFDVDGHPVLLYVTSHGHEPGPPNGPRHFRLIRWDGETWSESAICTTDHNYDMGSLGLGTMQPGNADSRNETWQAWLPSGPGPQSDHGGGEMRVWQSTDRGKTWLMKQKVTQASPRNHNYARRPMQARDPFFVFWADGDPTELSPSHLYFSDSSGKKVWRLPYSMSGDQASPVLVSPSAP